MNRNKNLAKLLCTSMVIGNITPVFATVTNETNTYDDTTENVTKETEVLYQKAGNYFVTIPKTISLGADKQSPYSVKVEGDIPSDKQVYVSPIDGIKDTEVFDFYMHDTNTANPKADVVATVTQNKFYWNFSEVANGYSETDNQVTAEDLTSGTWKGTFDFEINMHKVNGDESHTHSYTETIIKEPTCTEEGEKKLTCSCGDTKTETIPATGHNIVDGSCTDCDVIVKTVDDLMAGGDISFDMGTVLAVDKSDTLKVNNIVIPEQNFTFDKAGDYKVTVETTNSDGTPIIININITIIINQGSEHTHSYTETIIKAATCTESGEKKLTCSCGDSKTESIPATGHNYGADDKCTNCGELNPNHKHSYMETITKEAGCEETGEKTLTCICGDSKTEVIPATGHNYEDGTCKNCGEADPNYSDSYPLAPEDAYMNWNYTLDEDKKDITLIQYIGSETDVTVYSAYPVNGTTYKTKLASNDSNKSSNYMFAGKSAIQSIKFGANIDTSDTSSMSNMFNFCQNLSSLDLSGLNTNVVTDMSYMFRRCESLTNLNLNMLNTSNVTNMSGMFSCCDSLNFDFSNFDTSNVTNMSGMFYSNNAKVASWTSLDLSNFDTSNVTDMSNMFGYCDSLINLDLSNFDTSKVTNMSNMFDNCKSLTSLDVSNFDTRNVTNMQYMFGGCSSLTSIDVSNFDTRNVINMGNLFSGCSSLTSIDLSTFYTKNVINMRGMFANCKSLTSIALNNFDTSNVTDFGGIFSSCSSLTSIDISNFDTSKATTIDMMFNGCSSLTSLDLSNFDTGNVTNMSYTFYGCSSLTSLDLGSFNTSKVTSIRYMFANDSKLKKIYVTRNKWSIKSNADTFEAFSNCGTSTVTYK